MDTPYFMFELNIPQHSTSMMAYSQVDLSPSQLFWPKESGSILIYGPYIQRADNTRIIHHTLTIGTSTRKDLQYGCCTVFSFQLYCSKYSSTKLPVQVKQLTLDVSQLFKELAVENWDCFLFFSVQQ